MGYSRLLTLAVVVMIIILAKLVEAGKKKQYEKKTAVSSRRRTPPPRARHRAGEENDHDHIRSTELSRDKKVEQLKTLREAGLLTDEEYAEKLKKVSAKR